ncbi:protocatechuate 3,4-dioxygenase subunit beta [Profundibacterium mesophilum]
MPPKGLRPRGAGLHPPALTPAYRSSIARAPHHPPIAIGGTAESLHGPVFGHGDIAPDEANLLAGYGSGGAPIGERIIVHGRLLDGSGRPVPGALIEIWQANSAGRYRHPGDRHDAPLDPAFSGCGRTLSGADGSYSFRTIRPGAYPWPNGGNDWRPAHIHFSVFGTAFAQRLVTQMYFEGDPLIPRCPIVATLPDPAAVTRLVGRLDMDASIPFDALAYRFDIVLRGHEATPFETRPEGN